MIYTVVSDHRGVRRLDHAVNYAHLRVALRRGARARRIAGAQQAEKNV